MGLLIAHFVIRLNLPLQLPTEQFLSSGSGRVVDIGAGSGRAAVGVLLAKPGVSVTGIDIYRGFYGIDDNTPARFMTNARIAGVAKRAEAKVGDARELPLATGAYDAAISLAAIDHLPQAGVPKALNETARVLKPGGEFLLMLVNVDAWAWVASPHAIAHHPRAEPDRWRTLLQSAGFGVVEQGTQPGVLYFLCRKRI
jgi:SAM-dependent methyltransferase